MTDEYRGEDVILERIRKEQKNKRLTWNEACRFVAEELHKEGLVTSATHARNWSCPAHGNDRYKATEETNDGKD